MSDGWYNTCCELTEFNTKPTSQPDIDSKRRTLLGWDGIERLNGEIWMGQRKKDWKD